MIVYGVDSFGGAPSTEEDGGADTAYVATLREARELAAKLLSAEAALAESYEGRDRANAFGMEVRIGRYVVTTKKRGRALVLAILNGKHWVRTREIIEWRSMRDGKVVRTKEEPKEIAS